MVISSLKVWEIGSCLTVMEIHLKVRESCLIVWEIELNVKEKDLKVWEIGSKVKIMGKWLKSKGK